MERPPSPADRAAARHYAETSARVQELEAQLEQVASETAALRAELARVESSISWQGIQALRRRLHGRGGEHSHAARAVSATLHAAAALAARGGAPAPPQPAPEPPP